MMQQRSMAAKKPVKEKKNRTQKGGGSTQPYPNCLGQGSRKCDNFCKTGDTCKRIGAKCEIKHPPKTVQTAVA